MNGELLKLPIGVEDFKELRQRDFYYIDKTELISDIIDQGPKVYLFTRPRRFGKSLNLSMLDAFFNIRYQGNKWFDGLKVTDHKQYVTRMNTSPVVYISMKDLTITDFNEFIDDFKATIGDIFDDFAYLNEDERVPLNLRSTYLSVTVAQFSNSNLRRSIVALCKMLYLHHGVKPIVLIDEYDKPLNDAFGKQTYPEILEFLKGFYSSILKGNEYLDFAVVTGVMQISKESIFSGMNNLYVNNVFSKDFDERYGFTNDEVKDLCSFYGHPNEFDRAKEWYDGYRFGNVEIYNPWSLLNFVGSGFVPNAYWAGTSGNDILQTLLDHADEKVYSDLLALANGETVRAVVTPTVVMTDIGRNRNAIYSVMATSGYLKAVPSGSGYELSVPNKEMKKVFATFMDQRIHSDAELAFGGLFDGLEDHDMDKVRGSMQLILDEKIPFILLTAVKDYALIIGAAAMGRLGRYTVSLEKEAGNGRADIIMVRNRPEYPNIILELKKTRATRPETLKAKASEALAQIKDRKYFRGLDGRILLYGIAFHSKEFEIVSEIIWPKE